MPRALQTRLVGSIGSLDCADSDTQPASLEVTQDVRAWLSALRFTVNDYEDRPRKEEPLTLQKGLSESDLSTHSFEFIDLEHLNLNKHFAESETTQVISDPNAEDDVYNNVFDDILCNLGNEIFQLDTYHKKYFREARSSDSSEFEHSIMHVFDDFLEEVRSSTPLLDDVSVNSESENGTMELKVPVINKIRSFGNLSALSDEVFLRSGSSSRDASNANLEKDNEEILLRTFPRSEQYRHASFDINRIFDKGGVAPVPPKRKSRLSIQSPMEQSEIVIKTTPIPKQRCVVKPVPKPRNLTKVDQLRARLDSDTEITGGFSRKAVAHPAHTDASDSGNNSPTSDDYSDYQNLWLCTSGCQKQVINSAAAAASFKENFGEVNTIRYDSLRDISNPTPDIAKQRIVSCGPLARTPVHSANCSSNKSDRTEGGGVEGGQVLKPSRLDDHKNKRLPDAKKTEAPRVKPPRRINADVVKCTSECDITDECHRALSRHGEGMLGMHMKRDVNATTPRDPGTSIMRVFNSATVPRAKEMKTFGNVRARINNVQQVENNYECVSDGADSVCGTDYLNTTATTEDDWESSVELISDSDSYRLRSHGRRIASDSTDYASESPIYENLRDIIRLKPIPDDVIAWKAMLMDPNWIEDEEDEV